VVEGLLRSSRGDDQALLAGSGLVEYVVAEIVHDGFHCTGQLQSCFDLLCELVRFSPLMYRRMLASLSHAKVRVACASTLTHTHRERERGRYNRSLTSTYMRT
jgi:hypothetical protein